MRIISGSAKGLKLAGPPANNFHIRPTSDRSREALFSILGQKVHGARVIDLFAGTGALGLETLSRGGKSAVFVDNSSVSISLIKRNVHSFLNCIESLNQSKQISIIKSDLRKNFNALKATENNKIKDKFDIIFLDPPYDKNLAEQTLSKLSSGEYLDEDGVIIVEERAKTLLPKNIKNLRLKDIRQYGDTGFWFYSCILVA